MSGYTGQTDDAGQARLNIGSSTLSSDLMALMEATDIQPGSPPSYQLCKTIFTSHPLGSKMVNAPIDMAQSQRREITIPGAPQERLLDAFNAGWETLGRVGADSIAASVMRLARIYGISSLAMGATGHDPAKPLPLDKLHELPLYFSVLDPLNTAGSLVLEQDPNKPDFQKPVSVRVGTQVYHPANTVVMMNDQPIYISWSDSAFGFSGRSVYQRALFPLKSYIQTMITDDLVSYKAGVMVAKMKSPSSVTNNRMMSFFGWKRAQVKTATTGNVLGIGIEEAVESIDLKNLEQPFRLAREDILKNIATAADMPARVLDQETLSGNSLADGTEDAKQIARWVERFRMTMQPLYAFLDEVVQRVAWNPNFYADLQKDIPEYKDVPYETAFYQWRNAFTAEWPSLLIEPESKLVEVEKVRFESVVALVETVLPQLDPDNRVAFLSWVADEINTKEKLFSSKWLLDEDALANYEPPQPAPEREPAAFSSRT